MVNLDSGRPAHKGQGPEYTLSLYSSPRGLFQNIVDDLIYCACLIGHQLVSACQYQSSSLKGLSMVSQITIEVFPSHLHMNCSRGKSCSRSGGCSQGKPGSGWIDEGDQESHDKPETWAWACLWHCHFLKALRPSRTVPGKSSCRDGGRTQWANKHLGFLIRKIQLSFASVGLRLSLLKT